MVVATVLPPHSFGGQAVVAVPKFDSLQRVVAFVNRTKQFRTEGRAGAVREETEKLATLVPQQEARTEGGPIEPQHSVAHAVDRDRWERLRRHVAG